MAFWLLCQPAFSAALLASSLSLTIGNFENPEQKAAAAIGTVKTIKTPCHQRPKAQEIGAVETLSQLSENNNDNEKAMDHKQCEKNCLCCWGEGNSFMFIAGTQINTSPVALIFSGFKQVSNKTPFSPLFRPPISA